MRHSDTIYQCYYSTTHNRMSQSTLEAKLMIIQRIGERRRGSPPSPPPHTHTHTLSLSLCVTDILKLKIPIKVSPSP